MSGPVLIIVSYVLLVVFVVTFVVRTLRIAKLPVHLRWELAPVPHEKGKASYGGSYFEEYEWWTKPREKSLTNELVYMFKEIVFLKGIWKNNRRMWWFSFPFHFGMYMLIVSGALIALTVVLELAGVAGASAGFLGRAVSIFGGVGYVLGTIGAIGLLASRLSDPRLKNYTSPVSLFNLLLLLAVFVSGGYALFGSADYAAEAAKFVGALLSADTSIAIPGSVAAHLVLVMVFLAYLPFTQMMHFVAKYFTYHQIRWDDTPLEAAGGMEAQIMELLGQPVTWSASHLKADGKKNWVDIATEDIDK